MAKLSAFSMNRIHNQLISQQLLELLQLDQVETDFECKKKNCCKKYKKSNKYCKSCPKK